MPVSFGAFKPVGHVVVAFPDDESAQQAAHELRNLGFGPEDLLFYTGEENGREMRELLAKELPELSDREQLRIAAMLRCLVSTQAWLRMREECGVPGTESGPVVAWVVDTIIRELRAGNTPAST